jgi:hypothetical protein
VTFSHGGATALVTLVLLGWPLVVVAMFLLLRARTAALWSLMIGMLFLPEGAFLFAGLPEYTKQTAGGITALLCAIALDGGRPLRVRPRLADLPIFLWCLGRVATSISNGLGVYDGFSSMFLEIVRWGIPYWIGRTYFSDLDGMRELARGIVVGGLLYVPLCLFEVRFSPMLHDRIYGFMTVPFYMVLRYGGYRPMVFMQSSLMVAMWMATATVVCAWLGLSRSAPRIAGLRTVWWVPPLFVTTLLCKAFGAITLMVIGIGFYYAARRWKTALPVIAVLAVVGAYPALRMSGILSGERVLATAELLYDEERLQSLGVRIRSEELFMDHSAERPLLGWGGWGRNLVVVEGVGRSVPDGLWVIALSSAGLLALGSMMAMYLTPAVVLVRRFRAGGWLGREVAPFAAMAILLLLYWVDCLSNAMINSVLVMAIGGSAGWVASTRRGARPTVASAATGGSNAAPGTTAPPSADPPPSVPPGLGRALSGRRRGRGV